jgi:hypothetical protein
MDQRFRPGYTSVFVTLRRDKPTRDTPARHGGSQCASVRRWKSRRVKAGQSQSKQIKPKFSFFMQDGHCGIGLAA